MMQLVDQSVAGAFKYVCDVCGAQVIAPTVGIADTHQCKPPAPVAATLPTPPRKRGRPRKDAT